MPSFLLDTCVIIDTILDRKNRRRFVRGLVEQGNTLACCAINLAEIYASMRPGEEARTHEFLDSLEYYSISKEAARMAGLLKYEYRRKNVTLSTTDVTIAAVALHHRLILLTDKVKHFPMKDLVLYPLP